MKSDPTSDRDPDVPQLAVAHPYPPVERIPAGRDSVGRGNPNDDLFQHRDVVGHAQTGGGKVNDRVDHELPGSVKGDVSAPLHLDDRPRVKTGGCSSTRTTSVWRRFSHLAVKRSVWSFQASRYAVRGSSI